MLSSNRPILVYQVVDKSTVDCSEEVLKIVQSVEHVKSCGIVYCFSRDECELYANYLTQNKVNAVAYHAGLSDKQRESIQSKWVKAMTEHKTVV